MIAACLHPDPARRPAAADVVDELERLGWSIDERNRGLVFEPVDLTPDTDDAPTDPRTDPRADPRADPQADQPADPRADQPADQRATGVAAVLEALEDDATVQRSSEGHVEPAEDPTLYRTDRRPPAQPSAAPSDSRRRLLIGIAGVMMVALITTAIWWPRGTDSSGDVEIEIVERPAGLTPVTELDWPTGVVGGCLVQAADALETVSCSEPHDLQRFVVGELDAATFGPDSTFDQEAVHDAIRSACAPAFESFVGVVVTESEFEAPFSAPSATTWADGDRTFQCLLGISGRRVVGDADGSSR